MTHLSVSILIPNYNEAANIENKILSLLTKLPDDWEIVVCDDGSTDDSIERIKKAANGSSKVVLLINDVNQGVAYSVNRLLDTARGKYLCFTSANDLVWPNFVTEIAPIAREASVGVITTHWTFFDGHIEQYNRAVEQQKPLAIRISRFFSDYSEPTYISPKEVPQVLRKSSCWIACHASLLLKELVIAHGRFDPAIEPYGDWYLTHTLAFDRGMLYVPIIGTLFIEDKGGYSSSFSIKSLNAPVLKMVLKIVNLPKKIRLGWIASGLLGFAIRRLFPKLIFIPECYRAFPYVLFKTFKRWLSMKSIAKSVLAQQETYPLTVKKRA